MEWKTISQGQTTTLPHTLWLWLYYLYRLLMQFGKYFGIPFVSRICYKEDLTILILIIFFYNWQMCFSCWLEILKIRAKFSITALFANLTWKYKVTEQLLRVPMHFMIRAVPLFLLPRLTDALPRQPGLLIPISIFERSEQKQ